MARWQRWDAESWQSAELAALGRRIDRALRWPPLRPVQAQTGLRRQARVSAGLPALNPTLECRIPRLRSFARPIVEPIRLPMLPSHWPMTATRSMIAGPAGPIEAMVSGLPETPERVAVICHPHPLHGGTMDNKVVTMLERTFRDAGAATIRFNFRGVGASAGVFDHGEGEGEDLAAVVNQAREWAPQATLWLAGFSFGSYVSARMAERLGAELLVSVAPPVGRFAFRELQRPPCRWIVVQGEADEVVDSALVFQHFDQLQPPVEMLRFAGTSHFFHGKLVELRERLGPLLAAERP
jgi:alpha/beta superfamily hydrolase